MSEAAYLWLASVSCFLGLSALALAMKTHWQQVFVLPFTPVKQGGLRVVGVTAIALSAFFCGRADHPSMAVLVWIMLLPLTAVVVALLLNYWPAIFRLIFPLQGLGKRA